MGEASGMRLLKKGAACLLVITVFWLASWPPSVAVVYSDVHGIAVDEEGVGLSDVGVQVYTAGGALVATTSTGSDGFFSISGWIWESGTYNIYLTKPGYAKVTKSFAVQKLDIDLGTMVLRRALRLSTSTLSLIASPGDKISIPFTAGNIGEETEVVEFLISKPKDWSVRVLYQSLEVTKAYISSGQSLTLQLEATVSLSALVNVDYNISLTAIGTTNSSLTFTISTRAQPTATVSGRVVDEYDNGMKEVEIKAYSSDGGFIKSVSTSSDGSFTIDLPIATTIALYFSKEGYVKVTKSVSSKLGGEAVELGEIVLLKTVRLYSSILNVVASPGDKLLFPFVVSNIGGESETVDFLVSSPEGWSTRILSQTNYEISKAALSSGASSNFQLEVRIPLNSTGDNNLTLTTVGRTKSSLDFMIKVQPSSKTMISCQFPGKSCAPGDTIRFQVKVTNPVDVEQRFSISIDPVPPGWIISIKSVGGEAVVEVTLGGSEFVDLVVNVSTPPSVSEGKYSLLFTAKSPSMSENLPLLLVVQRPTAGIELRAIPPYLDVYAGSQARFKLGLSNVGGYDQLLNLTAGGLPQDLRAWFEDASKQEITKVNVEAGQSKEFYVVVSTPKGARLGAQSFVVSVAGGVSKTVSLTLNVLGLYKLSITNANFYTSLNVGGQGTFSLTVRNDGTQVVTNVKAAVTGTVPDGFTVSLEPTSVYSLKVDETVTFTITVKTESSVNAGNYYINFNTWSDQTEAQSFTLRVEVVQEMSWTIYGGVLIVIAVIGLFLVYRRFGRR